MKRAKPAPPRKGPRTKARPRVRKARRKPRPLIARSHHFTQLFQLAPIGYVLLARDGMIREVNETGARLLEHPRSSLLGREFADFVGPPSRATYAELLRDAQGDEPARCEIELQPHDVLVPVRVTAGVLDGDVMLAFEDISERRAREVARARSDAALRLESVRKDEFLAVLSHELRNPLSPIRTSVSVLQNAAPGSEEAAKAIAIIDRSSGHLVRLVDDLLDITRISSGKIHLQRSLVELRGIVRETIDEVARSFIAHDLQLVATYPEHDVWVIGDAARLVQVFRNLLGNAEKFTPSGGRIDVDVALAGDNATITVRDTGVGIAPEILDRVFEPFVQGPQPLARSTGGLGLGLAMVKAIVELHGGHASIRSDGAGRGTEVMVTLPTEQATLEATLASVSSLARGRKVLIVEDRIDTAEALRFALTLKGHTVEVAHDGSTAVERAAQFSPDVVVCDIGLPGMDGYAVARELRRRRSRACLVALSGYARPEDVARAKEAGFDRHLAKPPRIEDLDQVIAAAP